MVQNSKNQKFIEQKEIQRVMSSSVESIFQSLKCQIHSLSSIVQVCVSSSCPQANRLCCLECVDQQHMGHEHVLISHKKFTTLAQEFHTMLKEKELLDMKLHEKLKSQQVKVNSEIDQYFTFIRQSLVKDKSLGSYENLNQMNPMSMEASQLKRRMNQFVGNHSWMFELNAKRKSLDDQDCMKRAEESIREKYFKLQGRLQEINKNCENDIKEVISRHQGQIKKLFHLFDELIYNIEDNTNQLEKSQSSYYQKSKLHQPQQTCQQSPCKSTQSSSEIQHKMVHSVFKFLNNLVGGSAQ